MDRRTKITSTVNISLTAADLARDSFLCVLWPERSVIYADRFVQTSVFLPFLCGNEGIKGRPLICEK